MGAFKKIEVSQSPTEMLRSDLVKLRSEATNHYAKAHNDDKERYAFAKKTMVFNISLEPYMDKVIIAEVMEHYQQLNKEIKQIKERKLDQKTKKHNIILKEFEYAEPVFLQALRIFHHSPLIEYETEAILDPSNPGIKDRIQSLTKESSIQVIEGDKIDELQDKL